MNQAPFSRSPWHLSFQDRVILLSLCVVVVALGGYRLLEPRLAAGRGVETLRTGERIEYQVDVNAADAQELDLLPGIGPKRAAAIVAYRARHGRFASLEDLAEVPGVTRSVVEKLDGLVCFGPCTTGGSPTP